MDEAQAPPVEEPRNPMGWLLLGVIFFALIALQAQSYFTRSPSEPMGDAELRLKLVVSATKAAASGDSLDSLLADLDKKRTASNDAERLWVIASYEDKHSISEADLDRLRGSGLKDGPVIADLYSKPKLLPRQAQRMTELLKGDSRFSTELATIHADEKAGLPSARSKLSLGKALIAGLLIFLLVLAGIGLWIAFAAAKGAGYLQPEGHPLEPLTIPQADAVAMRSGQLMASFVVVSFIVGALVSRTAPIPVRVAYGCAAQLGVVLIMFWLSLSPVGGMRLSMSRLGYRSTRPGRDILYGVAATAMNYPVLLGLNFLFSRLFKGLPQPEHPISVELLSHPVPAVIAGLLFSASIAAPLFEEVVFRATFLPALARVLRSRVWSVVITSLLFASIHPTGIPAWPGLAALGAMSCLLVYQTRSLVPSMVMHGLNNAIALIATLLIGG